MARLHIIGATHTTGSVVSKRPRSVSQRTQQPAQVTATHSNTLIDGQHDEDLEIPLYIIIFSIHRGLPRSAQCDNQEPYFFTYFHYLENLCRSPESGLFSPVFSATQKKRLGFSLEDDALMALVLIFQERVSVSADCDITKGQFEDKELKDGISCEAEKFGFGEVRLNTKSKLALLCRRHAVL